MWVRFESSAVRWGPRSCLLGLPPPLLWRAGRGLLSFSCLGHVRAVLRVARVGAPRVGCVRVVPVHLWLGRDQRIARGSGTCPSWGVVAGCGGVGCVCGVGMPRDCACWVRLRGFLVFGGAFSCACAPFWGCGYVVVCYLRVRSLVAVCPCGCLFVGCVLLCCVLLVCCGLFCLSAIACCAFRERSCVWCDMVHASLCGCAFDGNSDCRLLFTL